MSEHFYDYGKTFAQPVNLDPEGTALVIVDMQYHDAARGRGLVGALENLYPGSCEWFCDRLEQSVVPAISRLLQYFREHGIKVIYLALGSHHRDLRDLPDRMRASIRELETEGGIKDLLWSGGPDYAILEELTPSAGEVVVEKTTFGAFNGSNFDQVLRDQGVESIVFTGVTTACCIESTARDAADRGWGCVIVDEATAAFDPEAQEAALRAFHFNFGRVARSTHEVIAALDAGSPLVGARGEPLRASSTRPQ